MKYGCRKCRREGEKLFLKGSRCDTPKCAVTRRAYAPGQHGPSHFAKLSEYGRQLREKQRVKKIYGLAESDMKRYFESADKSKENTTETLIKLLESRIDNILYRAGITESRSSARQIVSHGRVKLNGKKVTIPSILLKAGDKISLGKVVIAEKVSKPASWLKYSPKESEVEVLHLPSREEVELNANESLVVEYYSR